MLDLDASSSNYTRLHSFNGDRCLVITTTCTATAANYKHGRAFKPWLVVLPS